MDILERIRHLRDQRGWTNYRLTEEAQLNNSTLQHMFERGTMPSIATLTAICNAFGITLSQFFSDGEMVELTSELKELFEYWVALTPNQKNAVLQVAKAMNHSEDEIKK